MAAAGHDIVCRPGYTEIAQKQGWSPERIVEGRKFVWNQLLVCCKDAPRAKNALLMAGPEYDGETTFHQLEINNKISGHALKQQLDDELLHFAPKGREEPPDMIVRFDLLLTAYLDIESADPWNPEKKIKKILSLLRHWDDLKVTVDIERDKLLNYSTVLMEHIPIQRMNEDRLMSYTSVCTKIKASWDSFVATDIKTTKIRSAKIAQDRAVAASASKSSSSSSDDVQLQILEHLKVMSNKLSEDEKTKTSKLSSKKIPAGKERPVKQSLTCMNTGCNAQFDGFLYQQVCAECFEKVKSDRNISIPLQGSRNGTDYTGKSISIVDSTHPRHRSRGAWAIHINTVRLRTTSYDASFQHHFELPPLAIHVTKPRPVISCPVSHYPPMFLGADSCAGGAATGYAPLIHGPLIPVNWVIEGMSADALVPVMGSGVAVFLVQDRDTSEDLILHYGGMLQCDPDLVTTSVASSSQIGHYFNATHGENGAQFHTANPDDAFMKLPGGRQVRLEVNEDGAFGMMVTPLHPLDPRMVTAVHLWVSKDGVYRPPGRYTMLPIVINNHKCTLRLPDSVQRFRMLAQTVSQEPGPSFMPDALMDCDSKDLSSPAVNEVLSAPAMDGKYEYLTTFDDNPRDLTILQHVMGGAGAGPIRDTLIHGHGGKQMLTKAALIAIESFCTRFNFPAARMPTHKQYRKSKIDRERKKFKIPCGYRLLSDTLHLGFPPPMFRYFQLFSDGQEKCMNCYAMHTKTGDAYLGVLQEHISKFSKPPRLQEVCTDAAPELIHGPAKKWMKSQCIKTMSGVPHKWQTSLIEKKCVRHFSKVTTHLMLDSQLPLRFLEMVGQMACLLISYLHIERDGRHTSAYFEMFGIEPDLRTLKRVGCEVFWLLNKADRIKFGSRGVRGVLIGIAAHTHPEWTYIVWSPLTDRVYYRRDVLFDQTSMPFRDARTLIASPLSGPTDLRRGIAHFTRSTYRDSDDEYNLDNWDAEGNPEPDLGNCGAESWLPAHDHVSSPIQPGDTLFIADNPTVVTAVSASMISTRDLISDVIHQVSPKARFLRDVSGILTKGRYSTRHRTQAAFFTYDRLGGKNDPPSNTSTDLDKEINAKRQRQKKDGSDLMGAQFWDAADEDSIPESFTVTGLRNESVLGKSYQCLEYQLTADLDKSAPVTHYSRVMEVRKWMDQMPPDALPSTPLSSNINTDQNDEIATECQSLFTEEGIGELNIGDGPLERPESLASIMRVKIKAFKMARKPRKIPQRTLAHSGAEMCDQQDQVQKGLFQVRCQSSRVISHGHFWDEWT
jgi:hypothetical protein